MDYIEFGFETELSNQKGSGNVMHGFGRIIGDGSIEDRGNRRYRIRFSLGRNPETGKYEYTRSKTVVAYSKSELSEKVREFRRELELEAEEKPTDLTVGEYAARWQEQRRALGEVKPTTIQRDEPLIRRIDRFFGKVQISELDAPMIINAYAKATRTGKLSDSMRHMVHQKLKQILDDAVADGVITANPALNKRIKAPRPECTTRNSLAQQEAIRMRGLLTQGDPESREMGAYLALRTGCRRGEVLGLQWKHISIRTKPSLKIEQQLVRKGRGYEPPKASSYRSLPLDEAAASRLKQWKKNQAIYLEQLGAKQDDNTPVITDSDGEMFDPDNYGDWFRDFCVAHGYGVYVDKNGNELPLQQFDEEGIAVDEEGRRYSRTNKKVRIKRHYQGLTFHELRHTYASLLIGLGTDISTAQHQLGHKKASTTLDIYTHPMNENARSAVENVAALLDA